MEDYPRTLMELEGRFGSEDACRQYLFQLRWPEGFVCPRCGGKQAWPMTRGRWLCATCRYQAPVTAGTLFQDSHLPLTTWFRAMWYVTSQKTGVSALGLQRVRGLGSYRTAWALLHKLRRAMVRPGRDRLRGIVEVEEAYWGSEEAGAVGRLTEAKALIIVAAEEDGAGIGRVRLRRIPDLAKPTLHRFIAQAIEPGSTVRTDGLNAYRRLEGYGHDRRIQREQAKGEHLLPRVHRVVSLLTTQPGLMATPFPALLRSRGRPSPLHRSHGKGSALPMDPSGRDGPPSESPPDSAAREELSPILCTGQ